MTDTVPPRRTVVSSAGPKAEKKQTEVQDVPPRKRAVLELISMGLAPLAGAAAMREIRDPNPNSISALSLDVYTISSNAEPIADAVVDLSKAYPVLGAALDKLTTVTPISALFSACLTIGLQIAENHGSLPPAMSGVPGIVIPREELAQNMREESEKRVSMASSNGAA